MTHEAHRYARINEGLELYARGDAWLAHEAWEAVWREVTGDRQRTLQALIQTAAAVHKHHEGVPAGLRKNLDKALANLDAVHVEACWGLDVVALRATLRAARAQAEAGDFVGLPLPGSTGPEGFVYLHGFASSPQSFKASVIVPALEARGWSVASPDLNEDDFFHLTVSRALARVRRLLRDRTILIGSSLGGYLASLLQQQDDRVVALVLMAPAFDFATRLRRRYGPQTLAAWARAGRHEVEHYGYGRPAEISYDLFRDAEKHPGRPTIRVPTYVLQGRQDDVVPADMVVEALAEAPEGRVELDLVDDDHALRASADRARLAAERFGDRFGFASSERASEGPVR